MTTSPLLHTHPPGYQRISHQSPYFHSRPHCLVCLHTEARVILVHSGSDYVTPLTQTSKVLPSLLTQLKYEPQWQHPWHAPPSSPVLSFPPLT